MDPDDRKLRNSLRRISVNHTYKVHSYHAMPRHYMECGAVDMKIIYPCIYLSIEIQLPPLNRNIFIKINQCVKIWNILTSTHNLYSIRMRYHNQHQNSAHHQEDSRRMLRGSKSPWGLLDRLPLWGLDWAAQSDPWTLLEGILYCIWKYVRINLFVCLYVLD